MKIDVLLEKINSIEDPFRRRDLLCRLLLNLDKAREKVYRAWKHSGFHTDEDEDDIETLREEDR